MIEAIEVIETESDVSTTLPPDELSEAERERWAAQARELQERVRRAHEQALKAASAKERDATKALATARAELRQAMRAAHAGGWTERELATATGKSSVAAHVAVTKTIPTGTDKSTQRRAKRIKARLKGGK